MKKTKNKSGYKVFIGDEELNFQSKTFNDPLVLGRQIIEAVEARPVEEHAAVAILQNGDFEDIRLDEQHDLSKRGVEKFLVFRSDRSFKFKIDDKDLEWPRACISGFVLKKLANLDTGFTLWLEVKGGRDQKISDIDLVSLDGRGVEHFFSLKEKQICIFVNSRRKSVEPGVITFEEIVKIAFPNTNPGPNICNTIGFTHGPSENPTGALEAGESTKLTKGMRFHVTETDKS
tara:strand:+ start:6459 stop:7154 length:696 start_codon:yes stop_codon:yes gene_type:complete